MKYIVCVDLTYKRKDYKYRRRYVSLRFNEPELNFYPEQATALDLPEAVELATNMSNHYFGMVPAILPVKTT